MAKQGLYCVPYIKGARHLYSGNEEPTLAELLDDPVMDAILQRDGLTVDHVIDVVLEAQAANFPKKAA